MVARFLAVSVGVSQGRKHVSKCQARRKSTENEVAKCSGEDSEGRPRLECASKTHNPRHVRARPPKHMPRGQENVTSTWLLFRGVPHWRSGKPRPACGTSSSCRRRSILGVQRFSLSSRLASLAVHPPDQCTCCGPPQSTCIVPYRFLATARRLPCLTLPSHPPLFTESPAPPPPSSSSWTRRRSPPPPRPA